MNIALVIPAGAGARSGNRGTARRWASMLRAAGHRVEAGEAWDRRPCDLMLALHARRSHASVVAFRDAYPERPIVLALTGTDVYRDIRTDALARASLALASRFIVLQPLAIEELPRELRSRACVVYQSCSSLLTWNPAKRGIRFSVIGHLRAEKDPLRAGIALAHVPQSLAIRVVQIGAALDAGLGAQASALQAQDRRYRWMDSVSHSRALKYLASSHAMIISSRIEGGANVVSEAIRLGVPVLASDIPGNLGLLGSDYTGYYRTEDDRALAGLMVRAATDAHFLALLHRQIAALRRQADPANEEAMLIEALAPMTGRERP